MKTISLSLAALLCLSAVAGHAGQSGRSVSLTQDPLVMRVNQDEFRIAFGINGASCSTNGCNGVIRYRVDWKAADGMTRRETRHVSYVISPRARRTIAVDRQYFHRGEGRGATEIVNVKVDAITCLEGTGAAYPGLAKL